MAKHKMTPQELYAFKQKKDKRNNSSKKKDKTRKQKEIREDDTVESIDIDLNILQSIEDAPIKTYLLEFTREVASLILLKTKKWKRDYAVVEAKTFKEAKHILRDTHATACDIQIKELTREEEKDFHTTIKGSKDVQYIPYVVAEELVLHK